MAPPSDRRARRGVWHYLGLGSSIGLLLIVVAVAFAVIVVPKVTGSVPLTVLTSSMKPGLPAGTLIIVHPVDPEDLHIGDVATYQIRSGEPDLITHRIVSIGTTTAGETFFTFQGDNNRSADPDQVQADQVQGKVWYSLPLLGHVNSVVGSNRSWLVPVLAALLLGYAVFMMASGAAEAARQQRMARRAARGSLLE
ncbi:signal peptidase I [Mycetocola miduiensis]|nr:signal peptidase I [Mycetocola miduiensis]